MPLTRWTTLTLLCPKSMEMKLLTLKHDQPQILKHHSLATKFNTMNSRSAHQTHRGDETEIQVCFRMRMMLGAQIPETKWTHQTQRGVKVMVLNFPELKTKPLVASLNNLEISILTTNRSNILFRQKILQITSTLTTFLMKRPKPIQKIKILGLILAASKYL